jgi:prefoldin subunit 5
MALENAEVLKNLQEQLTQVQQQVETGRATVLRLQGAIDVLSQIEDSKEETTEEAPVDGGEVESTEEG